VPFLGGQNLKKRFIGFGICDLPSKRQMFAQYIAQQLTGKGSLSTVCHICRVDSLTSAPAGAALKAH
jgi:hypothetical protein